MIFFKWSPSEVDMETNSFPWGLVNQVKESNVYPIFPIGIVPLGNQINEGRYFFIKEVKLTNKKKGKEMIVLRSHHFVISVINRCKQWALIAANNTKRKKALYPSWRKYILHAWCC